MLREGSKDGGSRMDQSGRENLARENLASRKYEPARQDHCSTGQHPNQGRMATLISDEIIPRLIAAHLPETADATQPDQRVMVQPIRLDALELAEKALQQDAGTLLDLVDSALDSGLPVESLLVEIMAPAARALGERWKDDRVDFIDVTIGLWRLQEIIHILTARHSDTIGLGAAERIGRRILCASAPDDDHSFGSVMLEEVFNLGGWSTTGLRGAGFAELMNEVTRKSFDVIALTVSNYLDSGALANLLLALRSASRNPGVSIMVGGNLFNEHPALADAVGADATASDARTALRKAEILVGQSLVRQMADGAGAAGQRGRPLRISVPG